MAGSWFGKKEEKESEMPQQAAAGGGGELAELAAQLGRLGQMLAQANEQLSAYLLRRESHAAAEPAAGPLAQAIAAMAERLDRLAVGQAAPGVGGDQALRAALEPLREGLAEIKRQNVAVHEAIARLPGEIQGGLDRLAQAAAPQAEPVGVAGDVAPSSAWERAILGDELSAHSDLGFQRQRLMSGVVEGDATACGLAGQLLVFQSAPAERLPQLLKDVGEAFYRWQPKSRPGNTPMEEALASWLQRVCEAAGINNTIELVHPGERFDSARHTATSRGVEITEVYGWIVLRDNGKVYTKATVAVR